MSTKRLDPECGGCTDLWLQHLQVVNIYFFIKIRTVCNICHIPLTQDRPLLYSKQRQSVPWPLAIVCSSGEDCAIEHRQFSGWRYQPPLVSGQERRESDPFYSSRVKQRRKCFLGDSVCFYHTRIFFGHAHHHCRIILTFTINKISLFSDESKTMLWFSYFKNIVMACPNKHYPIFRKDSHNSNLTLNLPLNSFFRTWNPYL